MTGCTLLHLVAILVLEWTTASTEDRTQDVLIKLEVFLEGIINWKPIKKNCVLLPAISFLFVDPDFAAKVVKQNQTCDCGKFETDDCHATAT